MLTLTEREKPSERLGCVGARNTKRGCGSYFFIEKSQFKGTLLEFPQYIAFLRIGDKQCGRLSIQYKLQSTKAGDKVYFYLDGGEMMQRQTEISF